MYVRIIGLCVLGSMLPLFVASPTAAQSYVTPPKLRIDTGVLTPALGARGELRFKPDIKNGVFTVPVVVVPPASRTLNSVRKVILQKLLKGRGKNPEEIVGLDVESMSIVATSQWGTVQLKIPDDKKNSTTALNATLTFKERQKNSPIAVKVVTRYVVSYKLDKTKPKIDREILAAATTDGFTLVADDAKPVAGKPVVTVRTATGFTRIAIPFNSDDLSPASLARKNFLLSRPQEATRSDGAKNVYSPSRTPVYDRGKSNTMTIEFDYVPPGTYTLTLAEIKDLSSNELDKSYAASITLSGGPQRGKYVPYPDTLPRRRENDEKTTNPFGTVTTRTARLFYFRDADRVVEIVRRDVQKLNLVGKTDAERKAADARTDANQKTDRRRGLESLAIRAAQRTREIRAEQSRLEEVSKLDSRIAELEVSTNGKKQDDPEVVELNRLKRLRGRLLTNAGMAPTTTPEQIATSIKNLRQQLLQQQQVEFEARNKVDDAKRQELRSGQEQFRREVTAGKTEVDSYAAGKTDSIDPVQQVTLTVIGTGLIQLRGPLRGINKIRKMIHQIDSPVGQVKVGIHTVQINGEHGDRMELVYEKIQKHIAHSRFMTNESLRLFRKAVSHVASERAAYAKRYPERIRIPDYAVKCVGVHNAHRLKYLYAFFGTDFLNELARMNSELLNYDNKLLSLNSMDSMSLAGALYVTALADNPVRERIIQIFEHLAYTELPRREFQYTRALTRRRHANRHLDRLTRGLFQDHLDNRDAWRIYKRAGRTYHFTNLKSFFKAMQRNRSTLNSVQYATVRLSQALKAQLVAEQELRTKLFQRSLLTLDSDTSVQGKKKAFAKHIIEAAINLNEEQVVELQEAMRSHSSNVDNYLKRLAIALEDDLNAQFNEPAFQQIRRASQLWDVNLGQVETTTILANNRSFAKVSPRATIEFDLPQRRLAVSEVFDGAQALVQEYGYLMKDPTFISGVALLSGSPAIGLSGQKSPLQAAPGMLPPGLQTGRVGQEGRFGEALEALIPPPSVYKFETGTGYEIRPVIQPDGHSIVYNFNYMYTTNVREPVRADEKHLGRVKRHFIHTDVQTSSYELREVSRYTVALKASRTSRGVPLLEDIPLIGYAFRPLPSDESSLQQNVILASAVIYPTMFDLVGLRWSTYADDISSSKLISRKQRDEAEFEQLREGLLKHASQIVNQHVQGHNSTTNGMSYGGGVPGTPPHRGYSPSPASQPTPKSGRHRQYSKPLEPPAPKSGTSSRRIRGPQFGHPEFIRPPRRTGTSRSYGAPRSTIRGQSPDSARHGYQRTSGRRSHIQLMHYSVPANARERRSRYRSPRRLSPTARLFDGSSKPVILRGPGVGCRPLGRR